MKNDYSALNGRWIRAIVIESAEGHGPIRINAGPLYNVRGQVDPELGTRSMRFEAYLLGDHAEGYVVELVDECEVARHNARRLHSIYWEEWGDGFARESR